MLCLFAICCLFVFCCILMCVNATIDPQRAKLMLYNATIDLNMSETMIQAARAARAAGSNKC